MIYLYEAGKRNSIVIDLLQQNKIKQKIVLIDKKIKYKEIFNEKYLIDNFNCKRLLDYYNCKSFKKTKYTKD